MKNTSRAASIAVDPAIWFRPGDRPGARYLSGRMVFDEMFLNGRLCTRYWNANGQVWPDMYFGALQWAVDQPTDTFRVAINGNDLSGGFEWESANLRQTSPADRPRPGADGKVPKLAHGVISLRHPAAGLRVQVHTRLDGGPFLIRWLEITNLNRQAVSITAAAPFAGALWRHRYDEHLPPSAKSPFELAYNHQFEWGHEGDFYFEPLADGSKVVNGGKMGRSGWGRPAFWIRDACNGQTFVCELAWGGNYEFELIFHDKPLTHFAELFFRMGLSGMDRALRVLDAGETLSTPAVHLALFQDDPDTIVQASHDHVRHVVMPAQIPGRHVEIEANHRGYLCDRENVADIVKDVDVAASVGAEMYVIDAGWFGNEPNRWYNNTGDWHDGHWMKKGGGLKAVSDHVHRRGLKFGLWVEIEAAGCNSTLRKEHPDWLLKRNGEPICEGRALDFTNPAVVRFAESEISRLIRQYRLDMYRIDHNHWLMPAGNRVYQGFTEDLIWRYYEQFYAMFDRLRAAFPKVVFQNCAGGGGRLDWGTLARFHNTELSDWMRMPRGLRILNGVTRSLPPEILLRTFGTEVGGHTLEGDVNTQLRLCFCRPIFRGIAPSLAELSPYLRERIEHYLGLYRAHIRPVMIEGRIFHHSPLAPLAEPTPWCVLEYASRRGDRGVVALFRTARTGTDEFVFRPRGLDPALEYAVLLDNSGRSYRATGRELITTGIPVRLDTPLTSELIVFSAPKRRARA